MTLAGLIAQSYPAPEWATFFEVSNTVGFGTSRRADAIALGIWPSRGNKVIGFEFKEDRRDWLRELKNPAKAETIAAHCDEWWLVVGAEGIAKIVELPAAWGLKVASKDRSRLLSVKPAVPFPDRNTAVMSRTFVAAMLRKVGEKMVLRSEVERLADERLANLRAAKHPDTYNLELIKGELSTLQERVRSFEAASGVTIGGYYGTAKIGEAVKAVMACDNTRAQISRAHATVLGCEQALKAAHEALAALAEASL